MACQLTHCVNLGKFCLLSLKNLPWSRISQKFGSPGKRRVQHLLASLVLMPTLNDSSRVQLFVTACTVAHQALLSMGFFRQNYYSGLPFPSPRDLPNLGIEAASPVSPSFAGRFFITNPSGNCLHYVHTFPSGS